MIGSDRWEILERIGAYAAGELSGEERPEVPEAVINYTIRRAYVSSFFRQTEGLVASIGRAYIDAFVYYLNPIFLETYFHRDLAYVFLQRHRELPLDLLVAPVGLFVVRRYALRSGSYTPEF